jgi:hypothetical protein
MYRLIIFDDYTAVEFSETADLCCYLRNIFSGNIKSTGVVMAAKSKDKPNRELSSLTKGYLISYNVAQVLG